MVVTPASVEYETVPAEYEWVEGEIEGSTVDYITPPAQYETIQETVVTQEASTELVSIPPIYNPDGTIAVPASTQERVIPSVTKMVTRRVIKTPAATVERVVPYEIKDGKTRVPVKPAKTVERAVPAVTKQVQRRVIKTPASTQERIIPPGTRREVNVRTLVAPQKFYLRDDDGKIVREFENRDAFEKYQANLTTSVKETEKNKIKQSLDQLRSGGSTAGAAGLELAYNKAQESFDEDGINRVILATDGDFNVGFSSPDEMKTYIEKKRESGIFLSVLGFGNGNYNIA